ncbi:MAG TPA: DUF2911 domain-containing protein, partial [Pyrinomonadaceae bacterium]|nr:DUF2911 domain-containing protein [Pyrinomonadaceae bacterium]
RPSQNASVMQTVGITDVTITYSRPGVKKRAIWGELVPYDKVWRAGANEATVITFSDDVTINGQKLAAGRYSLHAIPSKDEWTLLFNKAATQGNYSYDEKQDALRVKVKPQTAEFREWMTFEFADVRPNAAEVALHWERVRVPFTIDVGDVNSLTLTKARATVTAAKADDWATPMQAARFSFENKGDTNETTAWLEKSLKIKEAPGNLWLKARIMADAGKTQDAITYGERSVQLAKAADPKADTSTQEKTIAEWKAKKM